MMSIAVTPVPIADAAPFPARGTPAEKLRVLVQYAVLAPSTYNTQPWQFVLRDHEVELYADATRALPGIDPEGRERIISCGVALFYLRVALRHFGYSDVVAPFPRGHAPGLLARVRLGRRRAPTAEDHVLFAAIARRQTVRLPLQGTVLDPVRAALRRAARQEGAGLWLLQEIPLRTAVAALVAAAGERQWADPRFQEDKAAWLRLLPDRRPDGVPGVNLGLGELTDYLRRVAQPAARQDEGPAARDRLLALGAPLLAVLATPGDSPLYWLVAGQALGRVLLQAAAAGIAAAFLNGPIQVAETRARLRALLAHPIYPQVLLRLGYGAPVPPTPRRPLADMLRT